MSQESTMSQETFNNLWANLMDVTGSGEYTQLTAPVPDYEFHDQNYEGSTEITVNRLLVPAPLQGQDTISELFGIQQNPVSPDSQSMTPSYQNGDSPSPMRVSTPVATLPSNTEYPGPYGFEMALGTPPKETKSTTWTFSLSLNKLFARIAVSCPFKFKCAAQPPAQCIIRAMPIYAKPEHVRDVVKRCPNHTQGREYHKDNIPDSHFIRCDNPNAQYMEENDSQRQSVVVPLESLEAGDEWKTYLYQFMCNNSCAGGINRRPVQVVFTLESYNCEVLGRQVLEVRICACPGRDRKDSEKAIHPPTKTTKKPAKVTVTNEVYAVGPAAKRRRVEEEVFTITVRGRENYEVLLKMRDSLELASMIPASQLQEMKAKQAAIHKQMSLQKVASIPTGSQPQLSGSQQMLGSQPQQMLGSQPQQFSQQQQMAPLSQGFNFNSSLGQDALRPPTMPSLPTFLYRGQGIGMEETDGGTPITSTSSPEVKSEREDAGPSCQAADSSVDEWLKKIGMSPYTDNFHSAGYTQMFELDKDRFSMEGLNKRTNLRCRWLLKPNLTYVVLAAVYKDLNKMRIGTGHRNKIWKALLEYREDATNSSKFSQDLQKSASRASTMSLQSQNSGFSPGFYEVTRYTFRHTVTLKQDHDYCREKS